MKGIAKKTMILFMILSMLSIPAFAERSGEIRHKKPLLNQEDKKDDFEIKTSSFSQSNVIEERNKEESQSDINITIEGNKTVIKGRFKQTNTSFLLTVKSVEDNSIEYINTKKTDVDGNYFFKIQLEEGVYILEVTCGSEKIITDFKY